MIYLVRRADPPGDIAEIALLKGEYCSALGAHPRTGIRRTSRYPMMRFLVKRQSRNAVASFMPAIDAAKASAISKIAHLAHLLKANNRAFYARRGFFSAAFRRSASRSATALAHSLTRPSRTRRFASALLSLLRKVMHAGLIFGPASSPPQSSAPPTSSGPMLSSGNASRPPTHHSGSCSETLWC